MLKKFFKSKSKKKMDQVIPISLYFRNLKLNGNAVPLEEGSGQEVPKHFSVVIDNLFDGDIEYTKEGWKSDDYTDIAFINVIGAYILDWYE